jgi:GTP cyclohydrolase I
MRSNINIEDNLKEVIAYIGDNPNREGLIDTPKRMVRSWEKLFGGYNKSGADVLGTAFEDGTCNEMVILKNVEFYSTCEHHFLPFSGRITIGYLPNKKVVGISKIARLVEVYSRRLQIQERMTSQIADDIMNCLDAKGCMVVCEAQHLCMTSRGVEKQQSQMITSAVRGVFDNDSTARNEFMQLIKS